MLLKEVCTLCNLQGISQVFSQPRCWPLTPWHLWIFATNNHSWFSVQRDWVESKILFGLGTDLWHLGTVEHCIIDITLHWARYIFLDICNEKLFLVLCTERLSGIPNPSFSHIYTQSCWMEENLMGWGTQKQNKGSLFRLSSHFRLHWWLCC